MQVSFIPYIHLGCFLHPLYTFRLNNSSRIYCLCNTAIIYRFLTRSVHLQLSEHAKYSIAAALGGAVGAIQLPHAPTASLALLKTNTAAGKKNDTPGPAAAAAIFRFSCCCFRCARLNLFLRNNH